MRLKVFKNMLYIYIMDIKQIFKVKTIKKDPDSWIHIYFITVEENRAESLGKGPKKKLHRQILKNTYSFDIQMNQHATGFQEDMSIQRDIITSYFKKYLTIISHLDIHGESKSYTAKQEKYILPATPQTIRKRIKYIYKSAAKIHFHGLLTFNEDFSETRIKKFFDDLRNRFSIKDQKNKWRAVFYKRVKNGVHLQDRIKYQNKQFTIDGVHPIKPIVYRQHKKSISTPKNKTKKKKLPKNI
jgi:hypothetical protein